MRHLMSPLDFSVEELDALLNLANDIEKHPEKYAHACAGKKLATCFYEPSTRTRLSFEAAMLNLGGSVFRFLQCRFQFCCQRRKCFRYHSCYFLLRRHLCNASPKRRCTFSCFTKINHSCYQCRRRRSPTSNPDFNRFINHPFLKGRIGQYYHRSLRGFKIWTNRTFPDSCINPVSKCALCTDITGRITCSKLYS